MNEKYPLVFIPETIKEIFSRQPILPKEPQKPTQPIEPSRPIKEKTGCFSYMIIISIPLIILFNIGDTSIGLSIIMIIVLIGLIWFYYEFNIKPLLEFPQQIDNYNKNILIYKRAQLQYEIDIKAYNENKIEYEKEVSRIMSDSNLNKHRQCILSELTSNNRNVFENFERIDEQQQKSNVSRLFFEDILKKTFSNYSITYGIKFPKYIPDFILYDQISNLIINIEIDEPYIGSTGEPLHFIDSNYNRVDKECERKILEINIIIIRFAEEQIFKSPIGCTNFIKSVINNTKNGIFKTENDMQFPPIDLWLKDNAYKMAFQRYRHSYIPLNLQKYIDVEGNHNELSKLIFKEIETTITKQQSDILFIPYRIKDKWTLFDCRKRTRIQNTFDKSRFWDYTFNLSKSCIVELNGFISIISRIEDTFNTKWYHKLEILKHKKNLCAVYDGHNWGIVDDKNKLIIPCEYNRIIDFELESSFICLKKENKYGLVDLDNYTEYLPFEYDSISKKNIYENDNLLEISKDGSIGVFDIIEKKIIVFGNFEDISYYNNNICSVKKNGAWRLLNTTTNMYLNNRNYNTAGKFSHGFCLCSNKNSWFLVGENGVENQIDTSKVSKLEKPNLFKQGKVIYFFEETNERRNSGIYHIFLLDKYIASIEHKNTSRGFNIKIIEDKYVEIIDYGKYGSCGLSIYTIYGQKLTLDQHTNYLSLKPKEAQPNNKMNVSDTKWRIVNQTDTDNLTYDKKLCYSGTDLYILNFYSGFALVLKDTCFEADFSSYKEVGYIDIYGNMYWSDNA